MQPLIPYFQSIQFTIPMPEFLNRPDVVLHSFGLLAGFGFLYGADKVKQRLGTLGYPATVYKQLFVAGILAIIIGGPLGNGLLYHPESFFNNPLYYMKLSSGFSSLGVFIFATLALFGILKFNKQPFLPYADSISIGFVVGWLFARLGCTLNHEHPGSASNFFLARYCRPVEGWTIEWPSWMHYNYSDLRFNECVNSGTAVASYADKVASNYTGIVANHDTGLYEALYALVMVIAFKIWQEKPRFDGFYVLALGLSYPVLRFIIDFLRPLEHNPRFYYLTPAQWACLVLFSLAAGALYWRLNQTSNASVNK